MIRKISGRVSPPCAGVYRWWGRCAMAGWRLSPVRGGLPQSRRFYWGRDLSLPRARGLPGAEQQAPCLFMSLPRARGFTAQPVHVPALWRVSPPCAGVYRRSKSPAFGRSSLSPVRGGLPVRILLETPDGQCLPRARGFTVFRTEHDRIMTVSPPCVGVYRRSQPLPRRITGLSPVRGGLPYGPIPVEFILMSLPRTRGFTVPLAQTEGARRVSPPCAGVYRALPAWSASRWHLPLVRGDFPTKINEV